MSSSHGLIKKLLQKDCDSLDASPEAFLSQAESRFHNLMRVIYYQSRLLSPTDQFALASQSMPAGFAQLIEELHQMHEKIHSNVQDYIEHNDKKERCHYFYLLEKGLLYLLVGNGDEAKNMIASASELCNGLDSLQSFELGIYASMLVERIEQATEMLPMRDQRLVPKYEFPDELNIETLERLIGSTSRKSATALSRFWQDKLARYFIDPAQQIPSNDAPLACWEAHEPGSTQAIKNAVHWILDTYNEPLSIDYIQDLHRIISLDVSGLTGRQSLRHSKVNGPGCFRTFAVKVGHEHGISTSALGEQDIMAFTKKANKIVGEEIYTYIPCGVERQSDALPSTLGLYRCDTPKEDTISTLIEYVINEYKDDIAKAKGKQPCNYRDIIKACASLVHQLELIHPFSDCNRRSCQQILNKLLLENGLPLTILRDPAMIDGLAPSELAEEILQGMHYYEHFRVHGYFPTTEPPQREAENFYTKYCSDIYYLSLPREKRQILSNHEQNFIFLLDSTDIEFEALSQLSVDKLLILGNCFYLTLEMICTSAKRVDEFVQYDEELRHAFNHFFPMFYHDILERHHGDVGKFMALSEPTKLELLHNIYLIETLLGSQVDLDVNAFLELPEFLINFMLKNSSAFQCMIEQYGLTIADLKLSNAGTLELFKNCQKSALPMAIKDLIQLEPETAIELIAHAEQDSSYRLL